MAPEPVESRVFFAGACAQSRLCPGNLRRACPLGAAVTRPAGSFRVAGGILAKRRSHRVVAILYRAGPPGLGIRLAGGRRGYFDSCHRRDLTAARLFCVGAAAISFGTPRNDLLDSKSISTRFYSKRAGLVHFVVLALWRRAAPGGKPP